MSDRKSDGKSKKRSSHRQVADNCGCFYVVDPCGCYVSQCCRYTAPG